MPDDFLDRDTETLVLQRMYSVGEALDYVEMLKEQQEIVAFQARNLAEFLIANPLETLGGNLTICLTLEILSEQVQEKITTIFDELLTDLWENSRQLVILYLSEPS